MKQITVPLYKDETTIYHNREDENEINLIVKEVFKTKHYESGYNAVKERKNPVIFDIGAHIGMSTVYFSQIPGARIYSFEPLLTNYECLVENTKNLKGVKIFNYAISAVDTENRNFSNESLYIQRDNIIPTKCRTRVLEQIMKEEGINHIDLIKIDCEGAEYEIFITEPFKRIANKIDFIVGESHFEPSPFLPQDIIAILGINGFKTEFLPIVNSLRYLNVRFRGDNESEEAKLQYNLETMFFARRI